MTELTLDVLTKAVKGSAAAFRCRRRLGPAGGDGDKVFPPTFADAVRATESKRVAGRTEPVQCVLLDRVQSQADRMELALQEVIDGGNLKMPLLVVDFSKSDPIGDIEADEKAGRLIDAISKITSLQVPHRLADAILRDSEIGGKPFRKSDKGKALNLVSFANATPTGFEVPSPEPTVEYDGGGVWLRWAWQVPDEPRERPTQSQVKSQVESRVLAALVVGPLSKGELARSLGHDKPFGHLHAAIRRLVEENSLALTLPDKPNSRLQKYRLTAAGKARLAKERTKRAELDQWIDAQVICHRVLRPHQKQLQEKGRDDV